LQTGKTMLETLVIVACFVVFFSGAGVAALERFPLRFGYLAGCLICAGLLGCGLYLQYVELLNPCPLCVLQRIVFMALMAIFLVAAVHGPGRIGAYIYGTLLAIAATIGAAIATRNVWLQQLPPDRIPECGPGLDYMLRKYSMETVLEKVIRGSGECADPGWIFLGLSIAGWALVWFVLLGALAIYLAVLVRRQGK
jgi:disulfide bond formation protein DsbB